MKSIEKKFQKIQKANPNMGDYIVFAQTIKGQKFNKMIIVRWFNKLVPKVDYSGNEKKELIEHLVFLSNSAEECQK